MADVEFDDKDRMTAITEEEDGDGGSEVNSQHHDKEGAENIEGGDETKSVATDGEGEMNGEAGEEEENDEEEEEEEGEEWAVEDSEAGSEYKTDTDSGIRLSPWEIRLVFNEFDKDKSGTIERNELMDLAFSLGCK